MAADGSPIDLSFHDALFERSRVRNGAPHTGDGGGPVNGNEEDSRQARQKTYHAR